MVLFIYKLRVMLSAKVFLGELDAMPTKHAQPDAAEDTYIAKYFERFGDGIFIVCEKCRSKSLTSYQSPQGNARCSTSELGKVSAALVSIPIVSTGISTDR